MRLLAKILRYGRKRLFTYRNHKTIFPIQTALFNQIVKELTGEGWTKTFEYEGFDAWIDYGALRLKKGTQRLYFEWDNWDEGSIEGKESILAPIASKYSLPIVNFWRFDVWESKDEKETREHGVSQNKSRG